MRRRGAPACRPRCCGALSRSGALGQVVRTESGYRQYSRADVHTLRFIKRCRDLGFSMAEIAELVNLSQTAAAPVPA